MADGVAGGLVAGDGQQDEEEPELGLVERLPVDVGVHQRGDDVLAGILTLLLGHRVAVAEDLGVGLLRIRRVVRVVGVHHRVRPVEQLLPIHLRHAEEVGDGQQRQVDGHVFDEVTAALLRGLGDDVAGGVVELLLE